MLKLNVPYEEKEIAKTYGAYLDKNAKTWCLPRNKYNNIDKFDRWIPNNYYYIAETPIYIAESSRLCWKCKKRIKVTTFASYNVTEFYENEDNENNKYLEIEDMGFAFAFNIEFIPNDLLCLINKINPYYKYAYTKTTGTSYYNNHCRYCSSIQGDFYLHSEPGEPFFPITEEGIKNITLYELNLKFDLPVEWEFSQASNNIDIFEGAVRKKIFD